MLNAASTKDEDEPQESDKNQSSGVFGTFCSSDTQIYTLIAQIHVNHVKTHVNYSIYTLITRFTPK